MLVVFQTGHRHQETLDHLPGLTSVVGLRVGTLQTVQSRLDCLGGKEFGQFLFQNRPVSFLK